MDDLTIIIITHNDREYIKDCLKNVFDSVTRRTYRVIVVDNGSEDGTPSILRRLYENLHIIQNSENVGYAKANNQGITASRSRYVLLLNPDTRVPSNMIEDTINIMDSYADIGILGVKLVRPNETLDYACRRMFPNHLDYLFRGLGLNKLFPKSHIFSRYNLTFLNPDIPVDVEAVAGAFTLARRSAIDQVSGLDENFFIYGEDLDWCYRFRKAGWRVYYYPAIQVLHHKGGTTSRYPQKMLYQFYRSNFLLYRKHIAAHTFFFVNWLIYFGLWISFILSSIVNFIVTVYKKTVSFSSKLSNP